MSVTEQAKVPETFLQKVEKFVENVVIRQPAKIQYAVPTEKVSQQVDNGTLTEEFTDGNLEVTWTPNP
jgi:hypothetical protein